MRVLLHGHYDASRGATFLCRITGADAKRPLGILSGWPKLKRQGNTLRYFGPLPKSCGCSPPHPPRIGASSDAVFHTLTAEPLGKLFWKVCFAVPRRPLFSNPVTDEEDCDCPGTHRHTDFFHIDASGFLDRCLQAVAAPWTHQALPSRLHGLCKTGCLFHRPFQDARSFPGFHVFAGNTSAVVIVVLRYIIACPWSYGISSDASGVERCRRRHWRVGASCLAWRRNSKGLTLCPPPVFHCLSFFLGRRSV